MNVSIISKPVLVTREEALSTLVDALSQESILAVDTESNSLYAYREQVCLIQFSTPQNDYLVDPLAFEDLSPLAPIFTSENIEKVFHAAEYDVITLKRDFGFSFTNLFDTMVAARILGWKEVGLGSILEREFNVHLDKRYQRANWGKRPISADMLTYARLDTHYLISLRNMLHAELKANGRWLLAREDFRRLQEVNGKEPLNSSDACWRIRGAYDLTPRQAAVLQELCCYRDKIARAIDRPLFKVIGDSTLYAIALTCPKDIEGLTRLPGMSQKQVQRHGRALLEAVQRGLRAEPVYPPQTPRPDESYLTRLDALRAWRKRVARDMGVSSEVVMPRDLLYEIVSRNPSRREDLADILHQVPWRFNRFGGDIIEVLRCL